jgi:hypothetical protein
MFLFGERSPLHASLNELGHDADTNFLCSFRVKFVAKVSARESVSSQTVRITSSQDFPSFFPSIRYHTTQLL